jgi:hypothetical protein
VVLVVAAQIDVINPLAILFFDKVFFLHSVGLGDGDDVLAEGFSWYLL